MKICHLWNENIFNEWKCHLSNENILKNKNMSWNENIFREWKYVIYRMKIFLANENMSFIEWKYFLSNFATFRQPYYMSLRAARTLKERSKLLGLRRRKLLDSNNQDVCTAPEMIPTPKWSPTLKWSPNRPRNDPDPEMIPTFLLVDPEMIPKELANGN